MISGLTLFAVTWVVIVAAAPGPANDSTRAAPASPNLRPVARNSKVRFLRY
jgi:hypothetical protein